MKKLVLGGLLVTVVFGLIAMYAGPVEAQGRRDFPGQVYVTSQDLCYDTFVSASTLPPHGPFQLLVGGVTEYGPGQPGYVGGRWKVPDGQGGFNYFLCPLIPPGRPGPCGG